METVVVTASAGTFSGLAAALNKTPVVVEEYPLIGFEPPLDWTPLDDALARASSYGSLALSSPRAARAVVERMRGELPPVWVVGAATEAALQGAVGSVRVPPARTGASPGAAELARAMLDAATEGPVLFPCGDKRRDELPAILRANGLEVHEVVCYRSVLATPAVAGAVASRGNFVVVASPSVLQLLINACPPSARPELIAVGHTTAASARSFGWPPAAVATEPSTRGVARAITGLLATR